MQMRPRPSSTIFGNPKAGTPLMLASPSIAIDLPLKALIWDDADGKGLGLAANAPAIPPRSAQPADPTLVQNIAVVEALAARRPSKAMRAGAGSLPTRVLVITPVLAFLAIQLIRPAISHPPVTADLSAARVKRILTAACYDCHSNQTRLAWFDQIVPAYWLVASDVKEARRHLNFSEMKLPSAQQKAALYESVVRSSWARCLCRITRSSIATPLSLWRN